MRYVVAGAGGVGGAIGGRLTEAGRDVVLIARGAHLEALRHSGLRLAEPDRERVVRVRAEAAAADVDWHDGDVLLLACKTQDSQALLDDVRAVAPDVPVVCAQNGVANERFAAERFAAVQAICVMLPAEHLEPGVVAVHAGPVPGILDVGRYPEGVDTLTGTVAADLRAAGFESRADPTIMRWKYRKLLVNLGNAVEAGIAPDDPARPDLEDAIRREGEEVLSVAGIDVASPEEEAARRANLHFASVGGRERTGGSSWQSLAKGSGSIEADYLNGEIVRLGARFGVPTPVNAALQQAVGALAAAHGRPGSLAAADLLAAANPSA
jgi:2-dehydropantoate 2-reductase